MNLYNSEMLKLARQSRGMSQVEIGTLMGVGQGTISKIELKILPFSSELAQIASEILNYPLSFFKQNDFIYPSSLIYYRRKSRLSSKVVENVEARMNILRIALEKLLNNVDLVENNLLEWDSQSNISPSNAAFLLREKWKIPKGRINKLINLIEDHGILVIPFDFRGEDFDGLSFQTTKGNWVILFNSIFPTDKIRLTIAHELGHIVLHIGRSYDIATAEYDAFAFASEFLVPFDQWNDQFQKLDLGTLADMKRYWKVSMASLIVKAERTNLISKNQAKYLWQQMSSYRKREPVEIESGSEKSSLLHEILDVHKNDLNFSEEELFDSLALNKEDYELYFNISETPRFRILKL